MNSEAVPNFEIPAGVESETVLPAAVTMTNVSKWYGKNRAVNALNLSVPTGSVYALLGRNAAGKSTIMQLLLGLQSANSGSIDVLGSDPVKDGIEMRKKLGYIPERMPMYEWMTIAETLRFVEAQYPVWSASTQDDLVRKFRLPLQQRVRTLSRGQRALLTLVLAMSHNPELVLLDECTSGMDAIAREEFDRSVIELLHGSGRTVLFASHQINELERLCDCVGMVFEGQMLVQSKVDDLKATIRQLQVSGDTFDVPGVKILRRQTLGRDQLLTVKAEPKLYDQLPKSVVDIIDIRLEQIFVALVGNEENR